jgi:UMF1 family MFS transporter
MMRGEAAQPQPTTLSAPARPARAAVAAWVFYDFANTMFSMNIVSLYFTLWVVNVMGGTDAHYGLANGASMAVILLLSPLLGALTDQAPRRMPFLIAATAVCVGFTFLLGRTGINTALVFFAIANIGYQAGLQFYDSLLPVVSTEENRGRIGGIGIGVGYLGSLVGVAIGGQILSGADLLDPAAQTERYALVFQVTAILFLVFAIPCFIFVRERRRPDTTFNLGSVRAAVRQVASTIRSTGQYPGLTRFLVGRFFYTDAVNTVILFMGVYVSNEVGFTSQQVTRVLLLAICFAFVGGLLLGRVVDRIGPKRTLNLVLGVWVVVFLWTAAVGLLDLPGALFWPAACLAGIALGGTWAADRPYMLRLTPPDRIGEFYGLYGMIGRFAAITGPLIWALVVDLLDLGRPVAILTLLAGIIIAYFILRPVSDETAPVAALARP